MNNVESTSSVTRINPVVFLASDISMFEHIGFCGDSYLTGGVVLSENPRAGVEYPNMSWAKIIERKHGIKAYIYAHSGVTAASYIQEADCLPKLLAEPARQLYVISLGHNDAYHSTAIEDFKSSYRFIIDNLLSHAPCAKIILCKQSAGYGDINNGPELNKSIALLGKEYGIPVVDPADDPYLSSEIYKRTQVHNHPVYTGYAGMAEAFNRLFCKATIDYWEYFRTYDPTSK